MGDVRGVRIALEPEPNGWERRQNCAWCEQPYDLIDLGHGEGVALWVDYPAGSIRVCSEGCAIEVRQHAAEGWPSRIYDGATVYRAARPTGEGES